MEIHIAWQTSRGQASEFDIVVLKILHFAGISVRTMQFYKKNSFYKITFSLETAECWNVRWTGKVIVTIDRFNEFGLIDVWEQTCNWVSKDIYFIDIIFWIVKKVINSETRHKIVHLTFYVVHSRVWGSPFSEYGDSFIRCGVQTLPGG